MSVAAPVIPIIKPVIGGEEIDAVTEVLRSRWVTQGPRVAAFERAFANYVGADFACAVSSCTSALHLALLVLGVKPGDEVITVSHSYIATANSIRYCGAIPVFVDIDPDTFNMCPARVEEVITPRTVAILVVHQMGMPCDLAAVLEIARAHGLRVVEDAACAIGSEINIGGEWERIGRPHGDIACFSFHPRKILTTGDGGMITTSSPEWDQLFRRLRQHSMSVPDTVRHGAKEVIFETYFELGYNYRMTDIQAAVGLVQLSRLPDVVGRRRERAARYFAIFSDLSRFVLPGEPARARSNWQSFCVRLPEKCDQREVMQRMLDAGVATRRGIMCAHREPAYHKQEWSCGISRAACGCQQGSCARLVESEAAQDRTIILPLFHEMTDAEQDTVVDALCSACGT